MVGVAKTEPAVAGSIPHESAQAHVTGQAVYLDDLPPFRNELLVEFVGSPLAHARIVALDISAAARSRGDRWPYSPRPTCPGDNHFGPIFHDEELLAAQRVPSHRPADRRAGRREPRGPARGPGRGPARGGTAAGRAVDRRRDRRRALHRPDPAAGAGRRPGRARAGRARDRGDLSHRRPGAFLPGDAGRTGHPGRGGAR